MKKLLTVLLFLSLTICLTCFVGFGYGQNTELITVQKSFDLESDEVYDDIAFSGINNRNYVTTNGFTVSGTSLFASATGKTATIYFTGTGLEVIGSYGSDKGINLITLDGEAVGKVDCYSSSSKTDALYRVTGLENREHIVEIIITGEKNAKCSNTYFVLSSARLIRKLNTDDIVTYEEQSYENLQCVSKDVNAENLRYDNFYINNNKLISTTEQGSITYKFRGNAVTVLGDKKTSGGVVKILIDNKFYGIINTYSKTQSLKTNLFTSGDMGYGIHEVKIFQVNCGELFTCGTSFTLFGFKVYKQEGVDENNIDVMYDDKVAIAQDIKDYESLVKIELNDNKFITSTNFSYSETSGIYSSRVGSKINITFKGTGIEVYAVFAKDKARASVYLDGEFYCNFNTNGTGSKTKLALAVYGLEYAEHNVEITILEQIVEGATGNYLQITEIKYVTDVDEEDLKPSEQEPYGYEKVLKDVNNQNITTNGFSLTDDVLTSQTVLNTLEYKFRGVAIWVYANFGDDYGKFKVYIDNEELGIINTFNSEDKNAVAFTSDVLNEGIHTLKLEVVEKSYHSIGRKIEITGFAIFKKEFHDEDDVTVGTYDIVAENNYNLPEDLEYEGLSLNDKAIQNTGFVLENNRLVGRNIGDSVEITFLGKGLEIISEFGADKGRAVVTLDGKFYGEISSYADTTKNGVLLRLKDLELKHHNVCIKILSDKNAESSGYGIKISSVIVIRDKNEYSLKYIDSGLGYMGSGFDLKSDASYSNYYQNSVLTGKGNSVWFFYTFKGNFISVYGYKGTDGAVINMYIDGEYYDTVDTNATTDKGSSLWLSVGGLDENENHSIAIFKNTDLSKSGTVLSFDYFVIGNYKDSTFKEQVEKPDYELDNKSLGIDFIAPSKTEYLIGIDKVLSFEGAKFIEKFANGEEIEYELTKDLIDVSGVNMSKEGQYQIKVNFVGKEYYYGINVSSEYVTNISLDKTNLKTRYSVGECFDFEGGGIIVEYSSGRIVKYAFDERDVVISGFDTSKAIEEENITVNVNGVKNGINYTISVVNKPKKGCNNSASREIILLVCCIVSSVAVIKRRKED